MKITWVGHACFLIEGQGGRVLTDPYDKKVPYRPPDFEVDVVLVSHEHSDHNAVERVKGTPTVLRGAGEHAAHGMDFRGISSFHDEAEGRKRGTNTIFVFQMEGIRLVHLGDLGHPLTKDQSEALADVDVVFVPVGGFFTIGADEAAALVQSLLKARVVIPMHFKTDRLPIVFPIASVDKFAKRMENVRRIGSSEVTLTRTSLPKSQEVWILEHA
jgi:L-ascorbate metabolism protein UlaG (beta-lactamase superfamily)